MALPKSGKGNKSRDIKGNKNSPDAKVERLDEQMNPSQSVVDGSAQEVVKQDKPRSKKPTIAELTKQLEEANKKIKEQETLITEFNDSFFKRNQELAAAENLNKDISKGTKSLINRQKSLREKNDDLSKTNQDLRNQNSILTESIRQSTLKSPEEVAQAQKELESASEPKVDNSAKTEETATPESEAKTEQAQATQEPVKDANATVGTGEATADNMMTPEDAYNYFKNKDNYEKASNVFETPSFNEYIDSTTGKWIPRGYFDAYNAKDGINPKKFTFEHFKAKIPEDLSKKLTSAEATEKLAKRNAALKSYEEEYKKYNTGFQAYLRKHPKLANAIKWGTFGALGEGAVELGKWLNETYMAGQNDKDELQDIRNSLNDDEPEPLNGSMGNTNPENIAERLKGADESTKIPEDNSGTIEQTVEQQVPVDNVKPENTQVAANTSESVTPTTGANPTATQYAQGLPPVVVNNTPPTSVPTSVNDATNQIVNAGNQAPQAGSDAYGDLYDQGFIDFWAKRNPNLAYGVSQGRKA